MIKNEPTIYIPILDDSDALSKKSLMTLEQSLYVKEFE